MTILLAQLLSNSSSPPPSDLASSSSTSGGTTNTLATRAAEPVPQDTDVGDAKGPGQLSGGAIAGIIIAVLLPLLILFVIYIRYRRSLQIPQQHPHVHPLQHPHQSYAQTPTPFVLQRPPPPFRYVHCIQKTKNKPYTTRKFFSPFPRAVAVRVQQPYLPPYTGPIIGVPPQPRPQPQHFGGTGSTMPSQMPQAMQVGPNAGAYYAPAVQPAEGQGGGQRVQFGGVDVRRYGR